MIHKELDNILRSRLPLDDMPLSSQILARDITKTIEQWMIENDAVLIIPSEKTEIIDENGCGYLLSNTHFSIYTISNPESEVISKSVSTPVHHSPPLEYIKLSKKSAIYQISEMLAKKLFPSHFKD